MKKIYFVEDDVNINLLIRTILKIKRPDWDLQTFANAVHALEKIKTDQPNLVMTDMMMPEMDGLTFLEEMRKLPGGADIKVIVLSAVSDEVWRSKAKGLGALDYWIKPLSADNVIAALEKHLA